MRGVEIFALVQACITKFGAKKEIRRVMNTSMRLKANKHPTMVRLAYCLLQVHRLAATYLSLLTSDIQRNQLDAINKDELYSELIGLLKLQSLCFEEYQNDDWSTFL